MSKAKPVPDGATGVLPHLTIKDAPRAIEFYKKALGAVELSRHNGPDGSIMHASIRIGSGMVFLNEENRDWGALSPQTLGGTPVWMMVYVPDVDATFEQARSAGAEVVMPVGDQFWGDRYGVLKDPFGHMWEIATHVEDLSPEEMERRGRAAMAQMGPN